MPYMRSTCRAGRTVLRRYYYTVRYSPKGWREKKKNPSRESQKKANQRTLERKLTMLLNANFSQSDWYLTFSYRKEERPDKQELLSQVQKVLRVFRKKAKAREIPLKYIWVAEIGKRGAVHVHMVVQGVTPEEVRDAWKYGFVRIMPLEASGQYQKLAEYLVKYAKKTEESIGEKVGKGYNPSRNLIRVKEKKEVMKRNTYPADIPVPKGYYLDKESIREGFHEATGYPYLSYVLVRIMGCKT